MLSAWASTVCLHHLHFLLRSMPAGWNNRQRHSTQQNRGGKAGLAWDDPTATPAIWLVDFFLSPALRSALLPNRRAVRNTPRSFPFF